MENPIFVISDDHSYLGVYRTPEDAQSYLYYSRSFTKGYGSWPSVADLDRQATT